MKPARPSNKITIPKVCPKKEDKKPLAENEPAPMKPTIADPFNRVTRTYTPAPQILRSPVVPPPYNPGYYISQASRRYLDELISENTITKEELPFICELALHTGRIFNRPNPTLSDLEIAMEFRTLEHLKELADGTLQLDVLRRENNSQEVMPKGERLKLWKRVAERVLEEYEKVHSAT